MFREIMNGVSCPHHNFEDPYVASRILWLVEGCFVEIMREYNGRRWFKLTHVSKCKRISRSTDFPQTHQLVFMDLSVLNSAKPQI